MSRYNQDHVIESYRQSFLRHGDSAEALQWSSEGQSWRFDKLIEIATFALGEGLSGKRILEIGCGLGHLFSRLQQFFVDVSYTGIDIVPELIEHAKQKHPNALFECRDIFADPLSREFDFVFISGLFNAPYRGDSKEFLSAMLEQAFQAAREGLAFNFTSPDTNYFSPDWVLNEVISKLSNKVIMQHHYRNCDVVACVLR